MRLPERQHVRFHLREIRLIRYRLKHLVLLAGTLVPAFRVQGSGFRVQLFPVERWTFNVGCSMFKITLFVVFAPFGC
jgi:hypothetical protein